MNYWTDWHDYFIPRFLQTFVHIPVLVKFRQNNGDMWFCLHLTCNTQQSLQQKGFSLKFVEKEDTCFLRLLHKFFHKSDDIQIIEQNKRKQMCPNWSALYTIMPDVVYSIGCLQDTFFFPHFRLTSILGYSSNSFLHAYGISWQVVILLLPQITLSWELGECQCCDLC